MDAVLRVPLPYCMLAISEFDFHKSNLLRTTDKLMKFMVCCIQTSLFYTLTIIIFLSFFRRKTSKIYNAFMH